MRWRLQWRTINGTNNFWTSIRTYVFTRFFWRYWCIYHILKHMNQIIFLNLKFWWTLKHPQILSHFCKVISKFLVQENNLVHLFEDIRNTSVLSEQKLHENWKKKISWKRRSMEIRMQCTLRNYFTTLCDVNDFTRKWIKPLITWANLWCRSDFTVRRCSWSILLATNALENKIANWNIFFSNFSWMFLNSNNFFQL